jgi:hypothetical protein
LRFVEQSDTDCAQPQSPEAKLTRRGVSSPLLSQLEINSRQGYEYFEHALEAILSGTVCLVVFRGLAGLPIGPIYKIAEDSLGPSTPFIVASGALIGLLGACLAFIFAQVHARIMRAFSDAGLLDSPIPRALVGGAGICFLGVLFPHSRSKRTAPSPRSRGQSLTPPPSSSFGYSPLLGGV